MVSNTHNDLSAVVHDLSCPILGKPCRHMSRANLIKPASDIKTRSRTVITVPGRAWCGDGQEYIDTLQACPVTGFIKASLIERTIKPGQQVLEI